MRRVRNEVVWASIASIVCGALIASLLGGIATPWILVVGLLALGLVVTKTRRRRDRRVLRAYYEPARNGAPEQTDSRAEEDAPPPPPRGTRERTVLGTDPAAARRAGVRSRSLSTKRSPGDSDRLP